MIMRISRPCYDKYHRCPGWTGPGMHFTDTPYCKNGRIPYGDSKYWAWLPHRCDTCQTIVAPSHVRWLDPTWYRWWIPYTYRKGRYPFRRTSRSEYVDLEQQAIDTLREVGTDRANALADEIERGRERRERDRQTRLGLR